ncbi:MAG: Hsp70 family protein [Betaproteobacteria bacterium]|nr:Hsp70 family protein [Betaproteobacteria bacterium]
MRISDKTSSGAGVLGIDFGTSNSAVAWASALPGQARQVHAIPLEGAATTLPTALFFNAEDHRIHFGRDAVAQYLSGTEGRLMRSLKSLLGSPLLQEQTLVNGQQISFQDIISRFLLELRTRAAAQVGGQLPATVVMGRPVHFVDDDPKRDALAEDSLRQTALSAGFEHVSFQLEPIAAALDYEQRITQESLVLVTDIGGGTSDFTVVRLGPERLAQGAKLQALGHANPRVSDILATTGVHIGGTDFDLKLNLEQLMPLLGYRHIGPTGREVPSAVFFDLATWHLINWRYSAKAMREAQSLRGNYTHLLLHDRLMKVLTERLGHLNAHEVEIAKIECSNTGSHAVMDLGAIERGLEADMTPQSMAQHLQTPLNQVVACAQECLQRAGVTAAQLDGIYLTGGSSALKPFQLALQKAFVSTPLIEGDLFGGVAAGLACSSAT